MRDQTPDRGIPTLILLEPDTWMLAEYEDTTRQIRFCLTGRMEARGTADVLTPLETSQDLAGLVRVLYRQIRDNPTGTCFHGRYQP